MKLLRSQVAAVTIAGFVIGLFCGSLVWWVQARGGRLSWENTATVLAFWPGSGIISSTDGGWVPLGRMGRGSVQLLLVGAAANGFIYFLAASLARLAGITGAWIVALLPRKFP